jgi:hypothetical protein
MPRSEPPVLGQAHRILVGLVAVGALLIAGLGFVGSYSAVRALAVREGFGWYAFLLPIGIDAGIVVLLALDLLLTWLRIPFPLLRHTAWLLTAATIAFNGAAAWPRMLAVAMHATVPCLFVACVEAARHAIGRIADITADRHMESVRIVRWLLAFPTTWRLWRQMRIWELRSYDAVIRLEQDRLIYQARLRGHYGRAWRRRAPVEALMPLRLVRYGVPIAQTGPSGLAAAGIVVPTLVEERPVPSPGRTKRKENVLASPPPFAESSKTAVGRGDAEPVSAADGIPQPAEVQTGKGASQGDALLKERFDALSPADHKRSLTELADMLRHGTGYTQGTARKKLGQMRRNAAG